MSPGNKDDDDDVAKDDADGNEREAGSMSGDEETFDFMSIDLMGIDAPDVPSSVDSLEALRYRNPDMFVKRRKCFALAILMFLSEGLSGRFSQLSGEVHAGWKKAFGKAVTFDQLIACPAQLTTTFNFTAEEQAWFAATIRYFVNDMTLEQIESLGITDEHLTTLKISKPGAKAKAGSSGKVKPPH